MAAQSVVSEKSLLFAKRIAKCYVFLKEKKGETVMSKQLLRCGTSIGANVCEGGRQYVNIALKEAGEVMEQREQSEACFDFAESRQNSTMVKQTTGLT